jgi:LuxR family maltose regulon positive regulatory protein
LAPALSADRLGRAIEIQALRALAIAGTMGPDQALESLEWALHLAEPEGYVRLFVDEGEAMAHLLHQAAERGIAPTYVQALRAAFGAGEDPGRPMRAGAPPAIRPPSSLVEPLTPREEEVLQLLAEGLSNKEIGARLHLTEGTVKNYVSAIIAKLQANDRTHAVVTALRRGLVEL